MKNKMKPFARATKTTWNNFCSLIIFIPRDKNTGDKKLTENWQEHFFLQAISKLFFHKVAYFSP